MLALLLLLILTLSIAVPAMACDVYSTIIDVSASATEVAPGSTIQLYILETNNGIGAAAIHDVHVDLYEGSILIDQLTRLSPSFGGDAGNDRYLSVGETWTWTYEVTVNADTRYTAIGYGICHYQVITYPDYPDEMDYVDVTIIRGGEGLTPGFWKNHTDAWVGYSTGDDFDATFGVDWFDPDITLLEALQMNGGGLNALTRHAAAALLSAAHPEVDYDMGIAGVISAVQAVDPADKDAVTALKDIFKAYNEQEADID